VPDVSIRRELRVVSRRVSRAPLALTSDGVLLINLAVFDVTKRLEALLEAAFREPGEVFIGVPARPDEVTFILERAADSAYEAASVCAGRRRKGGKK
jgi:hypothetical protein